ncbi:TPA: hypothetical protein ACSP3E_001591 [Aeromonas veronii]
MKIDISSTSRKYRVIYADPAWQFKSKKSGGSMKAVPRRCTASPR